MIPIHLIHFDSLISEDDSSYVSLSQNCIYNINYCILSVWPICYHLLMFSKRINVPPSIPPILKGRLSPAKACKHIWQHPQNKMRNLQGRYIVPAPTGSVLNSGLGTYFEEQLDYQSNFQRLRQSLPRSVIAKPPAELAGPLHKNHSCFHPASFHFTDVHEQAQLEM